MNNTLPQHRFYTSTTTAWHAMLTACSKANESIYIEQYVLEPGIIGDQFITCLINAAKRGVHVQLLLDWWGSKPLVGTDSLHAMQEAGIDVTFYRQLRWYNILLLQIFPRDHRKILIVDKSTVFIGGVCIYDSITSWRDTMVECYDDHVITCMLTLFDDSCKRAKQRNITSSQCYHNNDLDRGITIYANTPADGMAAFVENLIHHIDQAAHSIRITTPYFTPTSDIQNALINAAKRGVLIEIVLSNYSKFAPHAVGKYMTRSLMDYGIIFYYYQPDMLHVKMMIIDDNYAAIGSCNLDGLSIHHNEEVMLVSQHDTLIMPLIAHFNDDKSQSTLFTRQEWNNRSLTEKYVGYMLYPLRYYL